MSAQTLPSSMTTAESPPTFHRKNTVDLVRLRHNRRSFNDILARASALDLGHCDAFSAEAIARHFLRRQQDLLLARVLEQHQLQRIGFRRLRNLVWLSSHCSWEASCTCGSLYKKIFHAKRLIDRVHTILKAPSPRSQVGDLLVSLSDLRGFFCEQTSKNIKDGKALFLELDREINKYLCRHRIKALLRTRALNQRANNGALRSMRAMGKAKERLAWGFTLRTTDKTTSSYVDGEKLSADGASIPEDVATINVTIAHHDPALPHEIEKPESSAFPGLHSLQKALVQLQDLKIKMYSVIKTLDTLVALVEGVHYETKKQGYIELLRSDSSMFDAVAKLISGGHASLSKDLDILREEVLTCFCFINSARDLVFTM